jgi:hypothetical protein
MSNRTDRLALKRRLRLAYKFRAENNGRPPYLDSRNSPYTPKRERGDEPYASVLRAAFWMGFREEPIEGLSGLAEFVVQWNGAIGHHPTHLRRLIKQYNLGRHCGRGWKLRMAEMKGAYGAQTMEEVTDA